MTVSAVIEKPDVDVTKSRYVYLAISDVRFFRRQWATSILVRTMKHSKDWTGGSNWYCSISDVRAAVDRCMGQDV